MALNLWDISVVVAVVSQRPAKSTKNLDTGVVLGRRRRVWKYGVRRLEALPIMLQQPSLLGYRQIAIYSSAEEPISLTWPSRQVAMLCIRDFIKNLCMGLVRPSLYPEFAPPLRCCSFRPFSLGDTILPWMILPWITSHRRNHNTSPVC